MSTIQVLPLGEVEPGILQAVACGLQRAYAVPCAVLGEEPLPFFAYHDERGQYNSTDILRWLSGRRVARPYLECLSSCRIYLLLMDRKYSGGPAGTLSATHEEYRHAVKHDMPVLVFVRGHARLPRGRQAACGVSRDGVPAPLGGTVATDYREGLYA